MYPHWKAQGEIILKFRNYTESTAVIDHLQHISQRTRDSWTTQAQRPPRFVCCALSSCISLMSSKRLCKVSVLCKNSSAWEINFGTSTCRANNDQLFSNAKHPSCLLAGLEFFSCQMKLFSSLRRDDWLVHQPTISWSGSGLPTVFYSSDFLSLGWNQKEQTYPGGLGVVSWKLSEPLSKHDWAVRQYQNYTGSISTFSTYLMLAVSLFMHFLLSTS